MAKPETDNTDALMSAYLDEELDAEGKSKLEEVLAADPAAQKELSGLQNMLRLVKNLPEEQAPPDFYEKVAKKIRRRKSLRCYQLTLVWTCVTARVVSSKEKR